MFALEQAGTGQKADTCCGGETILRRIRGEYLEMPGLSLTIRQAARLWSLEPAACEAILQQLVDDHVLTRTWDGQYAAAA